MCCTGKHTWITGKQFVVASIHSIQNIQQENHYHEFTYEKISRIEKRILKITFKITIQNHYAIFMLIFMHSIRSVSFEFHFLWASYDFVNVNFFLVDFQINFCLICANHQLIILITQKCLLSNDNVYY